MALSGVNLVITMAVNVSVLGIDLATRSMFPLLTTIQSVQIAEFLERLDVFFMISLTICGFFKVGIYLYAGVIGASDVFNVQEISKLVYPLGIVVLFLSMIIANNFAAHIEEGLHIVPMALHLPLQVIIPVLLLLIAAIKHRAQKNLENDIPS